MRRLLSLILAVLTVASMILAGSIVTAKETSSYKDVKTSRWSYADIMYVTEKGLMNGTSADKFAPAETMTRAMVVTVLYRLQGSPKMEFSTKFNDVKAGKWYTDAVLWAAENDIVNGVGNNKYAPMETITREQLATIIMRYAPQEYIITEERTDITGYADYKRVHDYAREALAWANAVGLITGKSETTLAPREGATREQFAAILKRFKEYDAYKYELVYNAPSGFSTYTEKPYELVSDADIYVAVEGNDSNPGTLDKPVKTFERARDMVRELKKTKTEGGIVVAFKAGNYGRLDGLALTSEDSGTEKCPITYCAYGDGDVVFANGHIISESEFKPIDESDKVLFEEEARENIYKVDLSGKFDKLDNNNLLFSSTGVCWEARYPNKNKDGTDGFFRDFTTRVEEEGKAEHEYDKLLCQMLVATTVDKFTTYDGMKITGFLRTGWFVDTFPVKSYDRDTNILTIAFDEVVFDGYTLPEYPLAYEDRMDDTIFFHNLAEFMDADGEYWFDNNTKQLYVYNPTGDYAISVSGTFMTLNEGADFINFVGLEFNCSTADAIEVFSDHITFKLCTFGNIAGTAVINTFDINNFLASECEFFNFASIGIDLDSSANRKLLLSANNVIENNYFHDFSLPQYFDASAIIISNDVEAKIAHNHFENGAHSAIRYNSCIDTLIEYNIFDNMMMTTADFGAVYTWHSEAFRDNHIRYNLFMNYSGGAKYGIYLDDGTAGQQVYGNIFYEVGGKNIVFNGGRDNVVHDNVFIKSSWFTWNPGLYSLIESGTPEEIVNHANYEYLVRNMVKEGEEGYDLWKDRWPIMYAYHTDPSKVGEVECLYTTVHYLTNNYAFGQQLEVDENGEVKFGAMGELFGQYCENNRSFSINENPIFTDPTHGDYSIREGADFLDNRFYKIGRY